MKWLRRSTVLLLATLVLVACAQLVRTFDSGYYEEVDLKSGSSVGQLVFSHNINGETQPCGCRKFPLGGLEQVAGHFHQLSQQGPLIYVDTGDLFFPSPVLPQNVQRSLGYTGEKLAEAMDQLGLKFFVPGDQDFALGIEWLDAIAKKSKFTFLLANLTDATVLKSQRWARLKVGKQQLIFIGVLDPELLKGTDASYFSSPDDAIRRALGEANPGARDIVVLLSHAGMERDQKFAETFPRLDWIIGAHSQSYTQRPTEVGKTQLVQVLSRNHFLGLFSFGLGAEDAKTTFGLLETREELARAVTPNPMTAFLQSWREGLARTQLEEQVAASGGPDAADPLPTFNSCVECHQKQSDFWQGTSHANAWHTLVAKKADNDTSCVGCHSAGWQHPQGFMATPARVRLAADAPAESLGQYTEALTRNYSGVTSVRALRTAQRKKLARGQAQLMEKFKVTHDYGNVQCINCHDKKRDHPFDGSIAHDGSDMAQRCLTCHTNDQSPEWYDGTKVRDAVVKQKLKTVACPKQ